MKALPTIDQLITQAQEGRQWLIDRGVNPALIGMSVSQLQFGNSVYLTVRLNDEGAAGKVRYSDHDCGGKASRGALAGEFGLLEILYMVDRDNWSTEVVESAPHVVTTKGHELRADQLEAFMSAPNMVSYAVVNEWTNIRKEGKTPLSNEQRSVHMVEINFNRSVMSEPRVKFTHVSGETFTVSIKTARSLGAKF